MLDFIRIACAVPDVAVGNVAKNAEKICNYIAEADAQKVDLLVFPELALTGATCGDLFFEDALHEAVKKGMRKIAECSAEHPEVAIVVGLPVRNGMQMYNCAAVIVDCKVVNLVAKKNLRSDEKRWFSAYDITSQKCMPASDLGVQGVVMDQNYLVEMGCGLIGVGSGTGLAVTFGSDLCSPVSDSAQLALDGAEVLISLDAAPEVVGSRDRRWELVKHQSDVLNAVSVYCSAGMMESTQDGVYSGHSLIAECGSVLAENEHLTDSGYLMVMDCDLGKVRSLRRRNEAFRESITNENKNGEWMGWIDWADFRSDGSLYHINKLPFIPETKAERDAYCREVFQIQVSGLKRRLKAINCNPVLGISGGLDSTLALLVAVEAVRQLGREPSTVYGVTMPCFGTSDRTYQNSWKLMETLGINARESSIKDAVTLHFKDIGHDPELRNTTYENAQARERTQILMDYSSLVNGIVVGTGDLSELALGWCTYNGDHMAMYGVNGSVPKTLIRWIVEAVADLPAFAPAKETLMDVLDTPISPELLPPDAKGQIAQQTEDIVGPYALHDFFLYHVLRYGFEPKKIYTLACRAFADDFDGATVKKWLGNFYRRFFTQQFKRSCQPDGVKALPVSLSPRTDWRMPSEASYQAWMSQIEEL